MQPSTSLARSVPLHSWRVEAVASALLSWYDEHGRAFSWRASADPYYVLVAEILLRKTVARTVEEYLPAFLQSYPDVEHLANADEDSLATVLAPIGLGRQRATQLRALASSLVLARNGEIPRDPATLASLPGVGRYTAGILASTYSGVASSAVDTNVARVICRVFGLVPSHAEARKSSNVWAMAGELAASRPEAGPRLIWAMLDLAATVCTLRSPEHSACPLNRCCEYCLESRL